MFECPRCNQILPDDTEVCPICGTKNKRIFNKKTRFVKFLIHSFDALIIIMSLVNLGILLTCSHYCLVYDYGIFAIHIAYCTEYPLLILIETVFLIALIAFPILSVVARKKMMRRRKAGVYMMIALSAGLLLWTVAFPICTFLATFIISPVLPLVGAQIVIFNIIAVTLSVLILTNENMIY